MDIKHLLDNVKLNDCLTKDLDNYLTTFKEESDRAVNVNSPSSAGGCLRANYFARTLGGNTMVVDARLRRVFDNGTHVHLRLQKYLTDMKKLIMDEAPVINDKYQIQGHTDGIIRLSVNELALLEIKSMKESYFTKLKAVWDSHMSQASMYLYCIEQRRKDIRRKYSTLSSFNFSVQTRAKYFAKKYQHLVDGKQYTKAQKINFRVETHLKIDSLLYCTSEPINKVIFLYECKNTQKLKEFTFNRIPTLEKEILKDYEIINDAISKGVPPKRDIERTKGCSECRYCNFQIDCFN